MPLRAKITNSAMLASEASASRPVIRELPSDPPNDVLFNSQYGLRTITLNRPAKLNSLDGSMIRKIVPRMQEWNKSQMANVVVIKGEGRAFCAGGDVAALAKQNNTPEGQDASTDYFALEYTLDHFIATYEKPYVAFIDGITMGGGVGLSVHAPFRIATERTVFAMPETTIGLFPDVGAGFFLPRLDGKLGMYLALTSEQLKGVNVFFAGVATHYLHSSSLPDLEARLSELQFRDSDSYPARLRIINSTIEEFSTGLPHDQPISAPVAGQIRETIDYVFQDAHSFNDMKQALGEIADSKADQPLRDWAAKTKTTIEGRSPTSCQVTIRQLREGAKWSIEETFRKEHKLAAGFMKQDDFVEGVSALLINKPKTKPNWKPVQEKTSQPGNSTVADIFSTEAKNPVRFLHDADYKEYPHSWTALPSERVVRAHLKTQSGDTAAVVKHFLHTTNNKVGVKEKVEEILKRKTSAKDGSLVWNS